MEKQPIRIPYEEGDYLVHTARNGWHCTDPECPCNNWNQEDEPRPACEMSEQEAAILEHPWYTDPVVNPWSDDYWR